MYRHYDNAGPLGVFDCRQAEFQAQVHDGNDTAAEIDHAPDVKRGVRDGGDVLKSHNFPDLHNADCEFLAAEAKEQILACSRAGGSLGGVLFARRD